MYICCPSQTATWRRREGQRAENNVSSTTWKSVHNKRRYLVIQHAVFRVVFVLERPCQTDEPKFAD